jgi:hypothetical protein
MHPKRKPPEMMLHLKALVNRATVLHKAGLEVRHCAKEFIL